MSSLTSLAIMIRQGFRIIAYGWQCEFSTPRKIVKPLDGLGRSILAVDSHLVSPSLSIALDEF